MYIMYNLNLLYILYSGFLAFHFKVYFRIFFFILTIFECSFQQRSVNSCCHATDKCLKLIFMLMMLPVFLVLYSKLLHYGLDVFCTWTLLQYFPSVCIENQAQIEGKCPFKTLVSYENHFPKRLLIYTPINSSV